MTTVISIKSKDGIIIASDSQGTSSKIKTNIKKVYEINSHMGIGTSGDSSQIELFVDELEQNFRNEIELELEFKNQMYDFLINLNRIHNYNHSLLCGYSGTRLFFSPISIVAVKPKNGKPYLYRMGFGAIGKNNEVSPYLYRVNKDYISIGSGSSYARLLLSQQERLYSSINKKISDLSAENNVGIASYIINEVKQIDLETDGRTQIALVNHEGYREVSYQDQIKCHQIMIDKITFSLQDYFSNNDKKDNIIKYIFPFG